MRPLIDTVNKGALSTVGNIKAFRTHSIAELEGSAIGAKVFNPNQIVFSVNLVQFLLFVRPHQNKWVIYTNKIDYIPYFHAK